MQRCVQLRQHGTTHGPPAGRQVRRRPLVQGNGATDDTDAFERALATISGEGVLYVPAGNYVITRVRAPPALQLQRGRSQL